MSETLTMSTKERQRLQVLGHLKHGKTTVVKAAAALGISERQMYRVLDRYRSQGDHGLIHRFRGRTSNRGYPPEVRTEALRLHRELYPDYGPTLFAEMLQQYHQLTIDADTLRRWLKAAASGWGSVPRGGIVRSANDAMPSAPWCSSTAASTSGLKIVAPPVVCL